MVKDDKILKRMHPSMSSIATKKIQEMGVELKTNATVTGYDSVNGEVSLSSGGVIVAEMYIPCHAATVNSSFMSDENLDDKKFIKVDEYLKVVGMENVFALGDV